MLSHVNSAFVRTGVTLRSLIGWSSSTAATSTPSVAAAATGFRSFSASSASLSATPAPETYSRVESRENDVNYLHNFIDQHSFGLLTCSHDNVPVVSHLPFVLRRPKDAGTNGTLICHLARSNPLCSTLSHAQSSQREILIVFTGPHGYISPQLYLPAHQNVPTWNYSAVHAYATPEMEVAEESAATASSSSSLSSSSRPLGMPAQSTLDELADFYETRYMSDFVPNDPSVTKPGPWTASQMSAAAILAQRKHIVGFSFRITRMYGILKMSQNKSEMIRKQIIGGLKRTGQEELAEFMQENEERMAKRKEEEGRQS